MQRAAVVDARSARPPAEHEAAGAIALPAEVRADSVVRAQEPPDAVIDEVAAQIRARKREMMLDYAQWVGKLIVERFYGGDLSAFHHRGRKSMSIRRLAERLGEDAPSSVTSLYNCVAAYELRCRLPCVQTAKHLNASHLYAVLALPAPQQADLLERAESQRISARELRRLVKQLRHDRGRPTGTRLPNCVLVIRKLAQAFGESEAALGNLEGLHELNEESMTELFGAVIHMLESLERVKRKISPKATIERLKL